MSDVRHYPVLLLLLVLLLAGCRGDGERASSLPAVSTVAGQCAAPATYLAQGKPSPCLTPGVLRTSDPKVICIRGQATKVRRELSGSQWNARRRQVLQRYGLQHNPGEIDHLLSLSGGGSNDLGNLWPEAAPQFKGKDAAEAGLHAGICKPGVTVAEARMLQDAFLNQWR